MRFPSRAIGPLSVDGGGVVKISMKFVQSYKFHRHVSPLRFFSAPPSSRSPRVSRRLFPVIRAGDDQRSKTRCSGGAVVPFASCSPKCICDVRARARDRSNLERVIPVNVLRRPVRPVGPANYNRDRSGTHPDRAAPVRLLPHARLHRLRVLQETK